MTETMIDIDQFRTEARAWIAANLERRARRRAPERCPADRTAADIAAARALQRRLFDAGYAGITYPAEYGGRGLTAAHERAFREEAADYVTPDLGAAGGVTFGPIGRSLLAHASPEFLRRHIPKILSGEEIWCQFYSEPEAGSDLAGIRTSGRPATATTGSSTARRSGAPAPYYADWAMCLARTDWDVPKHRGLTWFAVPTDAAGLTIRQITQINGNAEFCEEFLDDVAVTDDDIIGEVNHGWTVTQTMLVYERGAGESRRGTCWSHATLAPDLVDARPPRRAHRRPGRRARRSPAPTSTTTRSSTSVGGIAARLRSVGDARRQRSPPTASSPRGVVHAAAGPGWRWRSAAATRSTWPERRRRRASDRRSTTSTAGIISIAAGTNEMQRNGIGERVLGPAPRAELRLDQAVHRGPAQLALVERQSRLKPGEPGATSRDERGARVSVLVGCPPGGRTCTGARP